jgi:hypothetical protein
VTRVIYKYPVPVDDQWHEVLTPGPSVIVHVDCQGAFGTVNLWAEVDIDAAGSLTRKMRAFATGQAIPDGIYYVGTALAGPFVWHVYAEATP